MKKINHLHGGRLYSDVLGEGLKYIEDRMNGRIKSFKVPWLGLNRAGVGGLEWGSMLTIGARPGSGKTLVVSQILRESRALNSTQDFNILEFQFEMGGKQSAARAFAAETALDYNIVLSTDKQLDKFSHEMMEKYKEDTRIFEEVGIYRVMINESLTHKEIKDTIIHYYNELGGKPLVVSIDHSWLIKKSSDEKEKIATLYNATEMIMQLKNQLPICVIMITQLNRSIEEPNRKVQGVIANYPTSSDIFGGDALMQGSDMVVALSRPFTVNIPFYGPKGYIVSPDDVFMHLLKIRNGSDNVNMLFMKAEFKRQRMIEVGEPQASNQGSGRAGGGYVRLSQRITNAGGPASPDDIDIDDI
jgi:replicative DNA helicase